MYLVIHFRRFDNTLVNFLSKKVFKGARKPINASIPDLCDVNLFINKVCRLNLLIINDMQKKTPINAC